MPEDVKAYSIALRLQRTTLEECYVRVPVTSAIMDIQDDGRSSLNTTKMVEVAIELAALPDAVWEVETAAVEPHPIQKPQPLPDPENQPA